jgi:protein-S-isoprenylcysteine O-methyltransferase Ste14
MPPRVLDLNAVTGSLIVHDETPEERQSRLKREENDHAWQLKQKSATFYALGAVYLLLLSASAWCAFGGSTDHELLQWARSLVTLLAGGAVGYVAGKR